MTSPPKTNIPTTNNDEFPVGTVTSLLSTASLNIGEGWNSVLSWLIMGFIDDWAWKTLSSFDTTFEGLTWSAEDEKMSPKKGTLQADDNVGK